ncbi:MAG: class I SAM-dependent DNA methyltransferase [Lentisphaeria bacterium]
MILDLNEKLIKQEFDDFADCYDDVVINDLEYDAYLKIPQELLKLKNPDPMNKLEVLDLGCATGLGAIEFAKLGYLVDGIDFSELMLQVAVENGDYRQCFCANLNDQIWPTSKKYDFITALGTIEFLKSPLQFLKHCHSLLKSDGLIGVTFAMNCYSEASIPVHKFTQGEVQKLCYDANLNIKQIILFTGYTIDEEDINYLGIIAQPYQD